MSGVCRAPVLGALIVLASACSDNSYSSAAVTGQLGDPAATLDFSRGISIPEGSAASAHIELISHANKTLTGASIQSADDAVLRVVATVGDTSGYAFLGVKAGMTTVEVSVNGQEVQVVTAVVQPPPSSSVPAALDGGAGSPSVAASDAAAPTGVGPSPSD